MKKIGIGVFVVLLLVLTSSVAMADQPEEVGPAMKVEYFDDYSYDWILGEPSPSCLSSEPSSCSYYEGPCFGIFANDANGHSTWKCKLDLQWGEPVYDYFFFDGYPCDTTYSFEGEKLIRTAQCNY